MIHVEVVGNEGSTGKIYLPDEEEFFERGLTDSFQVSVCVTVYVITYQIVATCVRTYIHIRILSGYPYSHIYTGTFSGVLEGMQSLVVA